MHVNPPAFIVLDGPDAAGKTYYAETIKQLFPNAYYMHLSYIKDNREMFNANYRSLLRAECLLRAGRTVVLDRGWMSENIYSRVYRGGSAMPYDVRGLDRVIRRLGGVYVMAVPDPASAAERHAISCKQREEMYLPDEKITHIAQLYHDLYYGTRTFEGLIAHDYVESLIAQGGVLDRPDVMLYDIDQHGHDVQRHALMSCAKSVQLRMDQLAQSNWGERDLNLLGNLRFASHVIVGDTVNPNKSSCAWPFVDYGASSRVISRAMHEAAVDELDYVWVNANDPTGRSRLLEINRVQPMSFISLGMCAARTLDELGIAHKNVYHPSFVGRFGRGFSDLINVLR